MMHLPNSFNYMEEYSVVSKHTDYKGKILLVDVIENRIYELEKANESFDKEVERLKKEYDKEDKVISKVSLLLWDEEIIREEIIGALPVACDNREAH